MLRRIFNKDFIKYFCIGLIICYFYLLLSGSCFASTRDDIRSDLEKLGSAGVVGSQIYQTIVLDANMDNYSNYFIMVGQGQRSESVPSRVYRMSTNRMLYILAFSASIVTNYSNSTSNNSYFSWSYGNGEGAMYNYTTGVRSSIGSFAYNDCIEPFYLYTTAPINTRLITLGAGEEHGGNYLSAHLDFSPIAGAVSVSVNGFQSSFNGYNYDYSLKWWNFGYLDGFEDFDKLRFCLYKIYNSQTMAKIDDVYVTRNLATDEFNDYSGSLLGFRVLDGLVQYNSLYLDFSPYYLIVYGIDSGGVVQTSVAEYLIFRGLGSTIPSIIGSGDNLTDTDNGYDTQTQTQQLLSPHDLSSGDILGMWTSPNFSSGDNLFIDFFDHIYDLFVNDRDVIIPVQTPHSGTLYLDTRNIQCPFTVELQAFLSASWWVMIGYAIICNWHSILEKFNIGDIQRSFC